MSFPWQFSYLEDAQASSARHCLLLPRLIYCIATMSTLMCQSQGKLFREQSPTHCPTHCPTKALAEWCVPGARFTFVILQKWHLIELLLEYPKLHEFLENLMRPSWNVMVMWWILVEIGGNGNTVCLFRQFDGGDIVERCRSCDNNAILLEDGGGTDSNIDKSRSGRIKRKKIHFRSLKDVMSSRRLHTPKS